MNSLKLVAEVYLNEMVDPQNSKSKFKVTYDVYGSNRDVPLSSSHKHVYGENEAEAIATVKKLIGGRNHKAELIRAPLNN